jgi:hypothetical protein
MMLLGGIEPDRNEHEIRTFECPECRRRESVVVKIK